LISERLRLAAQADFVLALYKPQSRKRQKQWVQTQEIIRACRPGSTPVGVVRNAYRDQESVVVTDLDHLRDEAVDMLTTVLIGNSQSFVWNSRIITPRGYYAPKPDGPRVLVLGGTHEARLMARRIRERGAQVTLSYRGPAPASKDDGVRIYSGDFDVNNLTRFLREREKQFVVHITHMDATIIPTTAQQAAVQCAVPYLRWERPESIPSNPLVREVPSHQEAALALRDQAGTVFLTTGIKSLETYVDALGAYRAADLVVRLLPRAGTLAMAERLGLNAHQIVAMVGPYSRELNGALYDRYHVQAVVTKSSSDDLHSKVEPALERLIPVIVVRTAPASSGGLAMTLPEIEREIFGGTQGD
jgi:precorrin-3B C17-methyltransferase